MRRSILATSLAASIAASPANADSDMHGFDVMLGYNMVSPGSSLGAPGVSVEGNGGLGLAVGPSFNIPIQEKLSLSLGVFFVYDQIGITGTNGAISQTRETEVMSFGLQLCPTYRVQEAVTIKAGYEWDIPFGGSAEVRTTNRETQSFDIVWAPATVKDFDDNSEVPLASVHNLLVGASYDVMPGVGIALQAKFGLNGNGAEYGDNGSYKGAAKDEDNVKVKQVALGLAYRFRH